MFCFSFGKFILAKFITPKKNESDASWELQKMETTYSLLTTHTNITPEHFLTSTAFVREEEVKNQTEEKLLEFRSFFLNLFFKCIFFLRKYKTMF